MHQAKQAQMTKKSRRVNPIVVLAAHALPNRLPGLVAEHSPFAPRRGVRTTHSKVSADQLPKRPLDPAAEEEEDEMEQVVPAGQVVSSPGLAKVDGRRRRRVLVADPARQRLSCTCLPMELQDGRDSHLPLPALVILHQEDSPSSPLYPLHLYLPLTS